MSTLDLTSVTLAKLPAHYCYCIGPYKCHLIKTTCLLLLLQDWSMSPPPQIWVTTFIQSASLLYSSPEDRSSTFRQNVGIHQYNYPNINYLFYCRFIQISSQETHCVAIVPSPWQVPVFHLLCENLYITITLIINQQSHYIKFHTKTLKIAPTCFDPKIILRELRCSSLK